MGRSDSSDSGAAGAIAVIVIGGCLLLLLLGCVGLGAVSFLFVRSSAPQVAYPTVVSSNPAMPPEESVSADPVEIRVVTNNAEGLAVIDGQVYTDDALRELVAADVAAGRQPAVSLEFTADLAADRRAAMEQIFAAREIAPATPTDDAAPPAP